MMGKCRRIGPFLAASVYEPLSGAEKESVERHLAGCARCRERLAEMQRLKLAVPAAPAELGVDLTPRLLARLHDRPVARVRYPLRPYLAVASAAAVMALVLSGFLFITQEDSGNVPTLAVRSGPVAPPALAAASTDARTVSPLESALDEAEALSARHAYADALNTLQGALRLYPRDPMAGNAQLLAADIEFSHLRRYSQAFDAYVRLRNQYPDVFASDPRNIERFDLLVETWQSKFGDLYTLDAARERGNDAFPLYEGVLVRNPGKLVALLALEEMAGAIQLPQGQAGHEVTALEAVSNRCTDPVAIAQVNLRLGDTYAGPLGQPGKARTIYESVLASGSEVLSRQAEAALARLDISK